MVGYTKDISKFFGKDIAKTAEKVTTATMKGSGKQMFWCSSSSSCKSRISNCY